MPERQIELSEPSELQEVQSPPLSMERFLRVQNNFFLQFVDEPLNFTRYQIVPIADALRRNKSGKAVLFPLNLRLANLQNENPDLERRLTEEMTKGDVRLRKEIIKANLHLLYEAYLIQRKYLNPDEDEWKIFDFFECS